MGFFVFFFKLFIRMSLITFSFKNFISLPVYGSREFNPYPGMPVPNFASDSIILSPLRGWFAFSKLFTASPFFVVSPGNSLEPLSCDRLVVGNGHPPTMVPYPQNSKPHPTPAGVALL
jgi:hypothetical protein